MFKLSKNSKISIVGDLFSYLRHYGKKINTAAKDEVGARFVVRGTFTLVFCVSGLGGNMAFSHDSESHKLENSK